MISVLTPLTRGLTVVALALMMADGAHSEQTSCTELYKCGWCKLDMSRKGHDSVQLSLLYANHWSLRESGYIAKQDFPRWYAGPDGHNSSLPIYLRVEEVNSSEVIQDEKLADVTAQSFGRPSSYTRTIESLKPGTRYTAFAYAKYEGGLTQGYTYEKPFVKICFTTHSDENGCPEGSVIQRYNGVTKSLFIACAAQRAGG